MAVDPIEAIHVEMKLSYCMAICLVNTIGLVTMEPFNNYVTPRGARGLSDALRPVLNTTLKSVTKGRGDQKSFKKALRNC